MWLESSVLKPSAPHFSPPAMSQRCRASSHTETSVLALHPYLSPHKRFLCLLCVRSELRVSEAPFEGSLLHCPLSTCDQLCHPQVASSHGRHVMSSVMQSSSPECKSKATLQMAGFAFQAERTPMGSVHDSLKAKCNPAHSPNKSKRSASQGHWKA